MSGTQFACVPNTRGAGPITPPDPMTTGAVLGEGGVTESTGDPGVNAGVVPRRVERGAAETADTKPLRTTDCGARGDGGAVGDEVSGVATDCPAATRLG